MYKILLILILCLPLEIYSRTDDKNKSEKLLQFKIEQKKTVFITPLIAKNGPLHLTAPKNHLQLLKAFSKAIIQVSQH